MYRLSYNVLLQQTDNDGNPNGETFSFTGQQITSSSAPQASDLAALATAMGADISAQMTAGYPVKAADDSAAVGLGGQG